MNARYWKKKIDTKNQIEEEMFLGLRKTGITKNISMIAIKNN